MICYLNILRNVTNYYNNIDDIIFMLMSTNRVQKFENGAECSEYAIIKIARNSESAVEWE